MEPGATKKLNHGSTYLPDLWPYSIHGHHHTDCVSLHLQNLRKNEVCFNMRIVQINISTEK